MKYFHQIILCFLLSFPLNKLSGQYCSPTFATCSSIYSISNVTIGGINNSSTCIVSAYTDYTSTVLPGTLNGGKNNLISVTNAGGATGNVSVWIDYNHNNTFDASEYTNIGASSSINPVTISKNIFVPSIALPGITRMRVKRYTSLLAPNNACFGNNGGETEDYAVNIIPPPVIIYYTPFLDTLYDKTVTIAARITQQDVGINNSDSLKPRIWYKKAGTSTWKSAPGELVSGTVNDGNWNFPVNHDSMSLRKNGCDSVQFYFVAQDLNNPVNLGYSPEPANHINVKSQVTPPVAFYGYRLKPRFKDTVYVSNGDCRYQSLSNNNGLFQQIKIRKLEGNLTIIIESDLTEQGIHNITDTALNGYRLTIRPSTNTIRTISTDIGYLNSIILSGVKNVMIDGSYNGTGKFLKFTNGNSPYSSDTICSIRITNSCDSILLQNLIFQDITDNQLASEYSVLLSKGVNKNISILNNMFTCQSANKMTESFVGSHYGNNTALVRGNEFNNFIESGVVIGTACDNWVIDSNHFYRSIQATASSAKWAPVNLKGGGHRFTNNYIGGKAPFCGGGKLTMVEYAGYDMVGIDVSGPAGAAPNLISNNRIDNIDVAFANYPNISDNFIGIRTLNNNCQIRNNIIGNPSSSAATISVLVNNIYGILSGGTGPADIRDNTISAIKNNIMVSGTSTSFTGIYKSSALNGSPAYTDPAVIAGNTISNINNSRNGATALNNYGGKTQGIYVMGGSYNLVEKNLIYDMTISQSDLSGITFENGFGATPSRIQKNRIYNLVNTSTTFSTCCNDDQANGAINGIVVTAESTGLDIVNNQVSITNNNIASPVTIRGIYEAGYINNPSTNFNQRIAYNSIYIGGSATNNGGSGCYYILNQRVKEFYNNIFFNERTGGTRGHFGVRFSSAAMPATFVVKKSNTNYYVVNDTLAFAHYGNTLKMSLSQWRAITSFDDSSYVVLAPQANSSSFFVDKNSGNLNINFNDTLSWNVNNKALPYPSFPDDYDSVNLRGTSLASGYTDIGSDEFFTNTMAPGGVCAGSGKTFTSNITGSSYQWQFKTPSGFTDIISSPNYSGVTTQSLQLINIPYNWNNQQYRCVVDGGFYSNIFTLTVVETLSPEVTITSSPAFPCEGTSVVFTAVPVSSGNAPYYQWLKNDIPVGTNSNSYSATDLINGDIISVVLTSGAVCVMNATDTSNKITMTVIPRPPVQLISIVQPTCNLPTGTINILAPAGMSAYTVTGITPPILPLTQAVANFAGLTEGTYTVTATNTQGCVSLTTNAVVRLDKNYWSGVGDDDWHNPLNWSTGQVPSAATHVFLRSGMPPCRIRSADANVASIQLQIGAVLEVLAPWTINILGNCIVLPPF